MSLNAYYIAAIKTANKISDILNLPKYRCENSLLSAFHKSFYDNEKHLFHDGENTEHISLVGNSFVYGLGICDEKPFNDSFLALYKQHGIHSLSFFCVFPLLMGFVRNGRYDMMKEALLDEGAWLRILRENGTTTFEGWGKDTKWNTSLFHLTMSYAATFMADIDLHKLF